MFMKNKRIIIIIGIVVVLLAIPLIAMQFTTEVAWSGFDFLIMGILLLSAAFGCELVLRKVSNPKYNVALCIGIVAVFLLVWAELAVGIFGTPFAGS